MKIISWILDHPVTVSMAGIMIACVGIFCFFQIPFELAPDVELPMLTISYSWPNTNSTTMESQVTSVLEGSLQACSGISKISSSTGEGYGNIVLSFEKKRDIKMAELEINELIGSVFPQLPKGVSYPDISRSMPEQFRDLQNFMGFSLVADTNVADLRKIAEDKLYLPLASISGVSRVDINGGSRKIISVKLLPNLLERFGVSTGEVSSAFSLLGFTNRSVGSVNSNRITMPLFVGTTVVSVDEVDKALIKQTSDGRIIRVHDIGVVTVESESPQFIYRINGKEVIGISVSRENGSDMLLTAKVLKEKIAQLEPTLPHGIQLITEQDNSIRLKHEIGTIKSRALYSIVFVACVLLLTFRSFTTSWIMIFTVLTSICGTVALYFISGFTLNILTMAAFVTGFGIIIDNGIVVYDSIYKRFEMIPLAQHHDHSLIKQAITIGASEVWLPLIASNLTTIGALVPIVFLSEDLRIYLLPFLVSFTYALIISQMLSFSFIPVFCNHSLKSGKDKPALLGFNTKAEKHITAAISCCMRHKKVVFVVVILLIGIPLWLLPGQFDSRSPYSTNQVTPKKKHVKDRTEYEQLLSQKQKVDTTEILVYDQLQTKPGIWKKCYNAVWNNGFANTIKPVLFTVLGGTSYLFFKRTERNHYSSFDNNQTQISVGITMPPNSSLNDLDHICKKFESIVRPYSSALEKYTTNVSQGSANISIVFAKSNKHYLLPHTLYGALTGYGMELGGVAVSIYGIGPGFSSSLGEGMYSYSISVRGYNFPQVCTLADQVAVELKQNQRVREISTTRSRYSGSEQYELFAQLKREKIKASGIKPDEVASQLTSLLQTSGMEQSITIKGEQITIKAQVHQTSQSEFVQLEELKNKMIEADGKTSSLKLGDVVDFIIQPVLPVITRENQTYIRTVSFNFIGRYEFGEKLAKLVIAKIHVPYGYSVGFDTYEWGSEKKNAIELTLAILLSFLIIWIITSALFESTGKSFLIITALPLAAIGFFFSFYLFKAPFDKGGYAAALLLAGIAVNHSLILVSHIFNQLKERPDINKSIVIAEAAAHRARPVILTSVTTIAGLIPQMLFDKDSEIWYSMAVGIIGGIVVSSILIIVVLPAIIDGFVKANTSYNK